MFTGIITGIGRISDVHSLGDDATHGKQLTIATPPQYLADVGLGDSIAINGACMTVTSFDPARDVFTVDVSAEAWTRRPGWPQSVRSISKRRCARTIGSVATWSAGMLMASAG